MVNPYAIQILRSIRWGKKITDLWDIELYSTYASTEMSTAFTECSQGRGGHHHPELIIVEILGRTGQYLQRRRGWRSGNQYTWYGSNAAVAIQDRRHLSVASG